MMNAMVREVDREEIAAICRRFGASELSVFGSAATGGFSDKSDVDLLVDFRPEARIGFIALARMQRELAALFKRGVDLVPKSGLKPAIKQSILSSAELLYAA